MELRYRLLPYLYDLFAECEKTGLPIMRPLVLHYEKDENTWNLNDEFLVGEHLLVAPVLEQGQTKKMVYLPEGSGMISIPENVMRENSIILWMHRLISARYLQKKEA